MELCIEKMLVTSTAHLTDQYEVERSGYIYYEMDDYGWMVYCCSESDGNRLNAGAEVILEIARSQGCIWVKFDCDGPEIEGIKTYNW
jgi:hypothetical protein